MKKSVVLFAITACLVRSVEAQEITAIELMTFPLSKSETLQWDAFADGPDVFVGIETDDGLSVVKTRIRHDIVQEDMPLVWVLPEILTLDRSRRYRWVVYDSDLLFDDEMDRTELYAGSYFDGYDLVVLATGKNHQIFLYLNRSAY